MTKTITLCADDFGYNDFVSQGIINLVAQQRLSATSCMTNIPHWQQHLAALLQFRDQIEIGLHFNLTEKNLQLPHFQLKQLITASYLRKLNISMIEAELQWQLDNFKNHTGFLPDYIDGHQHIQQLPIIRNAIINVIKRNYLDQLPHVRVSSNGLFNSLTTSTKALAIHMLGASALHKLAKKNGIATNASFAGFSNFKADAPFSIQFEGYLRSIKHEGLIMCHPGLENSSHKDPIAASRLKEYKFFCSDLFLQLLQKHQVTLFSKTACDSNSILANSSLTI